MPPAPKSPAKKAGQSAKKANGEKTAKKPNGGKMLDSVLAEVRKLKMGSTVEFRAADPVKGDLNGKGERLLRVDGDTVAYVSVLENGNIRALRSKYGLKVTDADPKKVAAAIKAAVKSGPKTSTASTRTSSKGTSGGGKASGTTRQRQSASRKQASGKGGSSKPRAKMTAGSTPSTEPTKSGNGNGKKTNGNGDSKPAADSASSGS